MADKNWQAGGKDLDSRAGLVCLVATVAPFGPPGRLSDESAPASYVGSADPNMVWEVLIGGIVVCSLPGRRSRCGSMSALRRVKRSQLRRNAFVSSALNNLNQGVVMTDPQKRIVFCNDRYLEIYGLARSDIPADMTGPELLELRRQRGMLDVSVEDFYAHAGTPEGLITELPNGRSVLVKYFPLPNGGSVATHEDCSEQRKLSRQLASTKQFLESVLENVPVCVAAKSIEDGRYIFANRAFERFSRFSRDYHRRQARRRDFPARDDGQHRGGGPGGAQLARRPVPQRIRRRARLEEARARQQPRDRAQRQERAGIPDRVVRRRHRPQIAFPGAGKHQEVSRAGRRQHSGLADRRARQRRAISARQSQRRDHPQPAPRGCHRLDGGGYLQSAGSQADHRARRGGDQEARPAHRGTPDQHQGRAAAVPDAPHDGARRGRRAAISDQDPRGRHRPPPDRVAHGPHGLSRRPDRSAEPRGVPAGAGADDRGLRRHRRGIRGAVDRPRRSEGSQRRVRPCDRRQAADRSGAAAAGFGARRGRGAAFRRRVRIDHRRQAAGRRHAAGRAARRNAGQGVPDRRQIGSHRRDDGHLDIPAQWRRRRFAARQCRRGAVPRQGEIARLDQHL